jgi:hypothetical protein
MEASGSFHAGFIHHSLKAKYWVQGQSDYNHHQAEDVHYPFPCVSPQSPRSLTGPTGPTPNIHESPPALVIELDLLPAVSLLPGTL